MLYTRPEAQEDIPPVSPTTALILCAVSKAGDLPINHIAVAVGILDGEDVEAYAQRLTQAVAEIFTEKYVGINTATQPSSIWLTDKGCWALERSLNS